MSNARQQGAASRLKDNLLNDAKMRHIYNFNFRR